MINSTIRRAAYTAGRCQRAVFIMRNQARPRWKFERCWRTWRGEVGFCLLCLSSGVLVMDQRYMSPRSCPRCRREEKQRFL
eukprot:scaffold68186_cov37-Phaeocystis_antarctica.AAC.1